MRRRVLDNEQLEKPRSWGGVEAPRKMGGKLPCAPPSGCGNTVRVELSIEKIICSQREMLCFY
jgi:hypothetical protein